MHINDLPTLVLSSIFEQIFCKSFFVWSGWKSDQEDEWAKTLIPLHVCWHWRQVGLPIVHRSTFMYCIAPDDPQEQAYVKTKLDIIPETGPRFFPLCLCIHMQYSKDVLPCLQALLDAMRKNAGLLAQTRKVIIATSLDGDSETATHGSAEECAKAECLGSEACQLLPMLSRFSQSEICVDNVVFSFLHIFFRKRAQQLRSIKCDSARALSSSMCFPGQLEKLAVDFQDEISFIPLVCADNLQKLHIDGVNDDFTWSSFSVSQSQRRRYFPKLKSMSININSSSYDNVPRDDLSMSEKIARYHRTAFIIPQLKYLQITASLGGLSILCAISEPTILPCVSIHVSSDAYFTLYAVSNRRLKNQLSNVIRDSMPMVDIMDAILAIPRMYESSILSVYKYNTDIDFENWDCVSKVYFEAPIGLDDLVNWIREMPKMKSLSVKYLITKRNSNGNISVPGLSTDPASRRRLIALKLSSLVVRLQDRSCPEGTKDDIALFLKKGFPHTRTIRVE